MHISADLRSTRLSKCRLITSETFKLSTNYKQVSNRELAFYSSLTISDNLNSARNNAKRIVTFNTITFDTSTFDITISNILAGRLRSVGIERLWKEAEA